MGHLYFNALQHPYDAVWMGIGYAGQLVFGIRFLIQWLTSEKKGHSVIPIAFWYCSLVGGLLSFTYVVHQHEWPLLAGTALPLPIYARNIWMIYRDHWRGAKTA